MNLPKRTSARPNLSAGILGYRAGKHGLEVLLVHPGGPYWRNKDDGAWSIPKGEIGTSENPEQTARREFGEELGPAASLGPLQALGEIRQRGGKRVIAFSAEKPISTRLRCLAIPSRSSGRPGTAVSRPSRKSTAPNGSTWRPQDRRSCPDRSSSSIDLKRKRVDAITSATRELWLFVGMLQRGQRDFEKSHPVWGAAFRSEAG